MPRSAGATVDSGAVHAVFGRAVVERAVVGRDEEGGSGGIAALLEVVVEVMVVAAISIAAKVLNGAVATSMLLLRAAPALDERGGAAFIPTLALRPNAALPERLLFALETPELEVVKVENAGKVDVLVPVPAPSSFPLPIRPPLLSSLAAKVEDVFVVVVVVVLVFVLEEVTAVKRAPFPAMGGRVDVAEAGGVGRSLEPPLRRDAGRASPSENIFSFPTP